MTSSTWLLLRGGHARGVPGVELRPGAVVLRPVVDIDADLIGIPITGVTALGALGRQIADTEGRVPAEPERRAGQSAQHGDDVAVPGDVRRMTAFCDLPRVPMARSDTDALTGLVEGMDTTGPSADAPPTSVASRARQRGEIQQPRR